MQDIEREILDRAILMMGEEAVRKIQDTRVIIFGIGGVGSWCAESLVRTGVKNLTIVDSDEVSISNVNRQLMATVATIGQPKVEALKARLLEINPCAQIQAIRGAYTPENSSSFELSSYDCIIDCIDSLSSKLHLILAATSLPEPRAKFYSSMGAALKIDPTKIKVTEFWKVTGCPLAAALRQKMRKAKTFPASKFQCVYSEEVYEKPVAQTQSDSGFRAVSSDDAATGFRAVSSDDAATGFRAVSPVDAASDTWATSRARINGSLAHITAIFGFTLAGIVLQDIIS